MELGATVCVPNGSPKCGECPWRDLCRAKIENRISEYPRKAPKKSRNIEKKTILVIRHAGMTALRKRPEKGLLAGMYEFPTMDGHRKEEEVLSYLKQSGVTPLRIRKLETSKHIFTHKEWHMTGYLIYVDDLAGMGEYTFVDPAEIRDKYPVPSAFAAYMDSV